MSSKPQNHIFWQQRVQKERKQMVSHLRAHVEGTQSSASQAPWSEHPDEDDDATSRFGAPSISSKMSQPQSVGYFNDGRPATGATGMSFTTSSTNLKAEVAQLVSEQMEKMLAPLRDQLSDEVKRRQGAEATLSSLRENMHGGAKKKEAARPKRS